MTGLESKAPILKAMVEVAKVANKPYLALQLELDLMSSGGNVSKELLDAPLMVQDFSVPRIEDTPPLSHRIELIGRAHFERPIFERGR